MPASIGPAVDTLRDAGLPLRVDTVHLNGLSGLDRWGDVACLIVLGRTLPAPATVETLAVALTGRPPSAAHCPRPRPSRRSPSR